MNIKHFKFSTSYNQFYIEDKDNSGDTASTDFWSADSFKSRLAFGNGVIGVATGSYGEIRGEIEILERSNNIDLNNYDHVVETGLNVKSGEIQILDCPNKHLEMSVNISPGNYRVRIYSSGLDSVKEPDNPQKSDNDYYRIEIWPSNDMNRTVLKQYISPL